MEIVITEPQDRRDTIVQATVTEVDARAAVTLILRYIGEDPEREGLIDTPKRVCKALWEMTRGSKVDPKAILATQFTEACDEIVILNGIRFTSLCEHHLLPFVGTASVGYIPNEAVVGLSKLARLVECFAQRPQLQERLTNQVAQAIIDHTGARAAGVIIRARHECMACRGVRQLDATMVTSSMLGMFRDDSNARMEFLTLAKEH